MADQVFDQDGVDRALARLHADRSGTPAALTRSIEFADFTTAVQFIDVPAPRCEELDHHPDLALRRRWVEVQLTTHSAGGVTAEDVELAGVVDELAAELPPAGG